MTTAEATWSSMVAALRRRLLGPPAHRSVDDLYQAVAVAHRAASELQTVDGWNRDLRCTDAATNLNLAEAELREALAGQQWTARPTGLSDFAHSSARKVAGEVVGLLDDVRHALAAATISDGALAGSLAASRAAVEVAEARRALGDELRR